MPLAELALENLRCIQRAEVAPAPGINLIFGPNASGKTSLLESIFLLGRGRSFRTRNSERLIRHGRDRLVVFGRTSREGNPGESGSQAQPLGVQVSRADGTIARI